MANELNINLASFSFLKNSIAINISPLPSPSSVTVTGLHSMHDQVATSTLGGNLSKGNIATIGYVYLRNLDSTNNIVVGDGITQPIILKPGEVAFMRWNATNVNATASASTPLLEYMLIED